MIITCHNRYGKNKNILIAYNYLMDLYSKWNQIKCRPNPKVHNQIKLKEEQNDN